MRKIEKFWARGTIRVLVRAPTPLGWVFLFGLAALLVGIFVSN